MRTYLNLSTRPFTNHRLFWIAVIAVFFVSLWLLLWISAERSLVSAQVERLNRRISAQEELVKQAELDRQAREQAQPDVKLDDQQRMQLAAARQLISRRAFSWNRLIGDIEQYVPKDARILSLKVDEVSTAHLSESAIIEVKALGKTTAQMTEMMELIEKSGGLFVLDQSGQDAATDSGEVPFSLKLLYSASRGSAQ
jgi:predicted Holliday junction resolvase-like endonuclease